MTKQLITLEEHERRKAEVHNRWSESRLELNGIACPYCNSELFEDAGVTLTSYPPQREIFCSVCEYRGKRTV